MSGLVALVVQEAFELIVHDASAASFTPINTVAPVTPAATGSSLTGPERTTLFAPASRCIFDAS